jgi:group II intron reverse transcriptase/maturase
MLHHATSHLSAPTGELDLAVCWNEVKRRQQTISEQSLCYGKVNNLAHYLDEVQLTVAGHKLRAGAAPGVDGVTARKYRRSLNKHTNQLIKEVKNKSYQPSPTLQVEIPKDDGSMRLLGLPTTKDKHLQQGCLMMLEAICEPIFYDHSYGFRPHRSPKMAMSVFRDWLVAHDGAYVLEIDLSKFFDSIPHDNLLRVLAVKVGDKVILRLIRSWLKAGIIKEDGTLLPSMDGTPQGAPLSPTLSNIYLDAALDSWYVKDLEPSLLADSTLVRYADDFLMAFTDEGDMRRALLAVTARLESFGLSVNQKKTKATDLTKPTGTDQSSGTTAVNFLGFTYYWKPSPVTGWTLAVRTSEKSIKRFTDRLTAWMEDNGDLDTKAMEVAIKNMLRGHWGYFDVEGNGDALVLAQQAAIQATGLPASTLLNGYTGATAD